MRNLKNILIDHIKLNKKDKDIENEAIKANPQLVKKRVRKFKFKNYC